MQYILLHLWHFPSFGSSSFWNHWSYSPKWENLNNYNIISEVVFNLGIVLNLGSHFMEFLHFSDKWKTCLLYLYEQMNISCFAWCSVKFISWMLMHVCVDVMCVYANVLDMCFLFKLRSLGYDVMWCMNFDIT